MQPEPLHSFNQLKHDSDKSNEQKDNEIKRLTRELDYMSQLLTKCEKQRIEEKQEHIKERDRLCKELKEALEKRKENY